MQLSCVLYARCNNNYSTRSSFCDETHGARFSPASHWRGSSGSKRDNSQLIIETRASSQDDNDDSDDDYDAHDDELPNDRKETKQPFSSY